MNWKCFFGQHKWKEKAISVTYPHGGKQKVLWRRTCTECGRKQDQLRLTGALVSERGKWK